MADINKEASWVTARLLELGNATNDGTNVLITDANIQYYNAGGLANTLGINKGGTGATDAAGARTNLGVPASGDVVLKDTTAIAGNLPVYDAYGGFTDSNSKPSDFMPALASGATPGDVALIGSNNNISDSGISKDNLILAPQLASNNIKTDAVPYIYRQTGGGISTGNREYDEIVGGSIVHRQMFNNGAVFTNRSGLTTSNTDDDFTLNGTVSSAITARGWFGIDYTSDLSDHVLYVRNCLVSGTISDMNSGWWSPSSTEMATKPNQERILKSTIASTARGTWYSPSGVTFTNAKMQVLVYDLTERFGSAVADRIYAMEQASAGSGIAVLHAMGFDKYRPYTATPSLESVSGLQKHRMKDADGNVIAEYPLDSSLTLRGVAVLDDNNNIKFDGDEYAPDGTVSRRYGIITLDGTQTPTAYNWRASETSVGFGFSYSLTKNKLPEADNKLVRAISTYGQNSSYNNLYNKVVDDGFGFYKTNAYGLFFRVSDITLTTADAVKAYLQAHPITVMYELETPTTETAEPYDAVQICDPLGTEEYVTTGIVPVGHSTQYPEDAVKKLDGLPSDFSTLIAPTEVTYKATRAYTTGRLLIVNNVLYKATTSIASGATLTVGTNITATTLDEVIASL